MTLRFGRFLATLVLIGAGGFWVMGRWDASIAERDRALDRQTKAALAVATHWRATYSEVAEEAEAERQRAETARREAQQHATRGDSLAALITALAPTLDKTSTASDSARVCCRLFALQTLRHEADSAQLAARSRQLQAVIVQRDDWKILADSAYEKVIPGLERALKDEHDARRCRILFVPCPSRGTVAAVTAVVTAVVVLGVTQ